MKRGWRDDGIYSKTGGNIHDRIEESKIHFHGDGKAIEYIDVLHLLLW